MTGTTTTAGLELALEIMRDDLQNVSATFTSAITGAAAELQRLSAERDELAARLNAVMGKAAELVSDVRALADESDGVAGLHLNGDIARWGELLPGGQFERLTALDDLEELLSDQQPPAAEPVRQEPTDDKADHREDDLQMVRMGEKHTPGPWQAHHDHGWLVVESRCENLYIKVEKGSAARTHMADAQLIAAAPDLLEVVNAILRAPSIGSNGPGSSTIVVQDYHLRAARAAVAKAEEGGAACR